MPRRSAPLSNFPVVHSSDPSVVRDRLFAVYGANSFDVGKQNRTFAINTRAARKITLLPEFVRF